MIIGLTGMPGSGSNSVGDFLVEKKGFIWLSYSDILREELRKKGKEITRKAMQDLGNEIRERYGSGELSKRLMNKMERGSNYVVGTIRNPAEIEELRKREDFVMVHVFANQKLRFNRVVARNRESDPRNWEEFLALESKDGGVGEKESGLRIGDCLKMCDYTIVNDGTLEDLKARIEEWLGKIGKV